MIGRSPSRMRSAISVERASSPSSSQFDDKSNHRRIPSAAEAISRTRSAITRNASQRPLEQARLEDRASFEPLELQGVTRHVDQRLCRCQSYQLAVQDGYAARGCLLTDASEDL